MSDGNEWCGGWVNPSVLGVVLLVALFQGSTSFTESITLSKYGAYAQYQQTTSRLLPWFPGPLLEDDDDEDPRNGNENDQQQEVRETRELELSPENLELMERYVAQVEASAATVRTVFICLHYKITQSLINYTLKVLFLLKIYKLLNFNL